MHGGNLMHQWKDLMVIDLVCVQVWKACGKGRAEARERRAMVVGWERRGERLRATMVYRLARLPTKEITTAHSPPTTEVASL